NGGGDELGQLSSVPAGRSGSSATAKTPSNQHSTSDKGEACRLGNGVRQARWHTPLLEPSGGSIAREVFFLATESRIEHDLSRRQQPREACVRNIQQHITRATAGIQVVVEHHEAVLHGIHTIDESAWMIQHAR